MARQTHSSLDHAGVRILFCFPITPTKESPRVTLTRTPKYIHTLTRICPGGFLRGSKGDAVETHTRILERYQRGNWLQDQQKTLPICCAQCRRTIPELETNAFLLIICALVRLLSFCSLIDASVNWAMNCTIVSAAAHLETFASSCAHTYTLMADERGWIKKDFLCLDGAASPRPMLL